ncbi:MAG: hypothetical protein AAGA75_17185 [Cyanobacteria bacterium P01_E01_bin.6]
MAAQKLDDNVMGHDCQIHQWWRLRFSLGLAIATVAVLSGLEGVSSSQMAIANESINESSINESGDIATVPPESEVSVSEELETQEIAAAPQFLSLENHPVELELLDPDADLSNRDVITNRMISQDSLTVPSLWWARSQFGGKLLEHWLAYPGSDSPRRVDVVVDRQLWGLSTYLQRYSFVNYFGTAAKEFGYSLRVFNDQGQPLASYMCNFPISGVDDMSTLEAGTYEFENINCSVALDSSGSGALRGHSNMFETFF